MEIIGEIIFGFIAEIVLTIVGEAFVELGFHSLAKKLGDRFWKRVFLAAVYATGGFILGLLSLKILPVIDFADRAAILYFIFAPIIAGLALCLVSWIIDRGINDRGFFSPAKFIYGATFAFVFSMTRTMWG
jgi:hypothetical protein